MYLIHPETSKRFISDAVYDLSNSKRFTSNEKDSTTRDEILFINWYELSNQKGRQQLH